MASLRTSGDFSEISGLEALSVITPPKGNFSGASISLFDTSGFVCILLRVTLTLSRITVLRRCAHLGSFFVFDLRISSMTF